MLDKLFNWLDKTDIPPYVVGPLIVIMLSVSFFLTALWLYIVVKVIASTSFMFGAFVFWLSMWAGNLFRIYVVPWLARRYAAGEPMNPIVIASELNTKAKALWNKLH